MAWEDILKEKKKYSYNQMKKVFDKAANKTKGHEKQNVSLLWLDVRPTILSGFDRDEAMYSEKEMQEVKKKLTNFRRERKDKQKNRSIQYSVGKDRP